MIRTEQLSSDTMMFHVQGQFHTQAAKELSLSVFCSYHLGFKTFLCNLSRAILLDETATHQLVLIGEGLRDKGKTWRVINPPSSVGEQLILRTMLQDLPPETWN
jgi:anti-anti-sigma regulatory factor